MKQVRDVMTRQVRTVSPDDTIRRAAQCMDELNVGAVPVCEGDQVIGMITDRDIAIRGVACGMAADATRIGEIMSSDVHCCYEDQSLDEVMDEMCDSQIRRIPVLDRQRKLVGIVSLGDLAEQADDQSQVGRTLQDISSPSQPLSH